MRTVTMAILLMLSFEAQAIECHSDPQNKNYWAWRTIDGRQCWYEGKPGLSKSLLHWPATAKPTQAELPEPRPEPELQPLDDESFEARWKSIFEDPIWRDKNPVSSWKPFDGRSGDRPGASGDRHRRD
jgi:hypothetical protein